MLTLLNGLAAITPQITNSSIAEDGSVISQELFHVD
jgi:hypothetical protein